MESFLTQADRVLRRVLAESPTTRARRLAALVLGCGFFYGAVMGCFGGLDLSRWPQMLYSGIKVPLLLLGSFAISLPSFWVINNLVGLGNDFAAVRRAILGSQAGLAIVLAALAPYTVVWYLSTTRYDAAVLFNGVMFAIASATAQTLLRRGYRPLIARNARHRQLLRGWVILYVFVAIQMAWVLRPFIGAPGEPTQFFRSEAWGNAYVVVFRLIAGGLNR